MKHSCSIALLFLSGSQANYRTQSLEEPSARATRCSVPSLQLDLNGAQVRRLYKERPMKRSIFVLAVAFLLATIAAGQTSSTDDDAAIKATALNYIEGWYEGDAARMESALHPELAKRMILTDPKTGHSQFNHMGAMQLVQNTRRGGGSKTPKDQQTKEITILDRYNNAAVVKIVASGWIDYLEEAKVNGEWKIVNVLWELKPKPSS